MLNQCRFGIIANFAAQRLQFSNFSGITTSAASRGRRNWYRTRRSKHSDCDFGWRGSWDPENNDHSRVSRIVGVHSALQFSSKQASRSARIRLHSDCKLRVEKESIEITVSASNMTEPESSTRGDRDARWWMECQPHIRALRETMHSATANRDVENLLQKCVSLYMATIRHNSSLEDEKIYIALSGGRITAMEATFTWLGGWRPSTAILLVYSLMGVQLEDEIRNFGYGLRDLTNTSAVLSHRQITNLTKVQKTTRDVERKLSKKLAYIQMLISDRDVLAAVKTQVEFESTSRTTTRSSDPSSSSSSSSSSKTRTDDLRTVLKPRMSRLKKLLIQADQLRLTTLHQLFLVLTPVQVARCASAAFELAFMIRELGNAAHCRILRAPIPPNPELAPHVEATPSCNVKDYCSISVDHKCVEEVERDND